MLKNLIFLLACAALSVSVWGQSKYRPRAKANNSPLLKEINFNLGTHTEFYNAIQKDDSGGLRKFDFAPTLGFGVRFPMSNGFSVLPEFNWVLPQSEENSKIIINTFMFRTDLGYDPLEWLRLRLGTSLIWANQQGRGGKTQMRNGDGESTFYYPDENRSSLNNTLDVGVETIYDQFSFRLQTYIYSVFKEERRQVSYTLFLTYYWDRTK